MNNKGLNIAKNDKMDEFYTRCVEIENELCHYTKFFIGKTIYCNCDDYRVSNFFKYIKNNFKVFGLNKLIASCYKKRNLLDFDNAERAFYVEYDGIDTKVTQFNGDGDFRSMECIRLLEQSDIVITNPPFSMFREFVHFMIQYNKLFLAIGNVNAVTTKELFQHIKNGNIRLGVTIRGGGCLFGVPNAYNTYDGACEKKMECGKTIRVRGVRWFTNMKHDYEPELLETGKLYSSSFYPKYDNFDAINIDKTEDIPSDYKGLMGVPVTFIDKYNSKQFELVGHEHDLNGNGGEGVAGGQFTINGKGVYKRILIRKITK